MDERGKKTGYKQDMGINTDRHHLYTVHLESGSAVTLDIEGYRIERAEFREDIKRFIDEMFEYHDVEKGGTIFVSTQSGKIYQIVDNFDRYIIKLLKFGLTSQKENAEFALQVNKQTELVIPVTDKNIQNMKVVLSDLEGTTTVVKQYSLNDVWEASNEGMSLEGETLKEIQALYDEMSNDESEEPERISCAENVLVYEALESFMPEGVHYFEVGLNDERCRVTRIKNDFRIRYSRFDKDSPEEDKHVYSKTVWVEKRARTNGKKCLSKLDAKELEHFIPMLFVQNRASEVLDASQ